MIERALRGEEACRLTTFCEVGSGELTLRPRLRIVCRQTKMQPALDTEVAALCGSLYRVFLFADDLAEHRRLSQRIRANRRECPITKPRPNGRILTLNSAAEPTGLLNRLFLPAVQSCSARLSPRPDALHQALRLGLAAEKYRLRHGRLPARLEDLTPEFIPAVPLDPFDGKPMRMKRTDRGLIVYSIGPDGIDNGGTPIPPIRRRPGRPTTPATSPSRCRIENRKQRRIG